MTNKSIVSISIISRNLILFLIFSIGLVFPTFSQQPTLSTNAEISVLTVGPGASLNDAFGHNVFRINDRSVGLDIVYGYGEYDFDTPNFYLKFAQGKLNYKMSKDDFADFFYVYTTIYNRTIEEQVLNLSTSEKQNLYDYLITNYKPENRKYLYDFFYDNCATRIRDVVQSTMNNEVNYNTPQDFEPKTFRDLIYEHTGKNNWGSFGIDLALGSVIDRKATAYEHMFLPKYIHEFFGNAKIKSNKDLIQSSKTLYKQTGKSTSSNFFTSPLFILGILAILILYLTYSDYKKHVRTKWLDVLLFSLTGIVGIFMLLLWFATDHSATAHNYNLLWAMPLNVFMIGQLLKDHPKNWFRRYLKFLIIMICLLALHWMMGVQQYAIGLIPILIALLIRYTYIINHLNKK